MKNEIKDVKNITHEIDMCYYVVKKMLQYFQCYFFIQIFSVHFYYAASFS